MYTAQQIADALDFAVLKPTATPNDVALASAYVLSNKIRTLCVAPTHVAAAAATGVSVCAVVGFPHGNTTAQQKYAEASSVITDGAYEIDVVLNYGRLLAGEYDFIRNELRPLVLLAHESTARIKAILETCYYTIPQVEYATKLCIDCGVDFVKTSTGFGLQGATPAAVRTMVAACRGTDVQVKASGGIVCYNDVSKYLDLGCTRLGASRYKELLS